jgi:hypothetical protein
MSNHAQKTQIFAFFGEFWSKSLTFALTKEPIWPEAPHILALIYSLV